MCAVGQAALPVSLETLKPAKGVYSPEDFDSTPPTAPSTRPPPCSLSARAAGPWLPLALAPRTQQVRASFPPGPGELQLLPHSLTPDISDDRSPGCRTSSGSEEARRWLQRGLGPNCFLLLWEAPFLLAVTLWVGPTRPSPQRRDAPWLQRPQWALAGLDGARTGEASGTVTPSISPSPPPFLLLLLRSFALSCLHYFKPTVQSELSVTQLRRGLCSFVSV